MCFVNSSDIIPCPPMHTVFWRRLSKKHNLRVHRLNRRRRSSMKDAKEKAMVKRVMNKETDDQMEMKNWKLYMENKSIIQENEKLKKKALLLHQENKVLLTQLQSKFSHLHNTNTNTNTNTNNNHL